MIPFLWAALFSDFWGFWLLHTFSAKKSVVTVEITTLTPTPTVITVVGGYNAGHHGLVGEFLGKNPTPSAKISPALISLVIIVSMMFDIMPQDIEYTHWGFCLFTWAITSMWHPKRLRFQSVIGVVNH